LLNNQSEEEFDTLFTRNKPFSQGMDLVNQLFSMAVKGGDEGKKIKGIGNDN
jgi:hypothetical protein